METETAVVASAHPGVACSRAHEASGLEACTSPSGAPIDATDIDHLLLPPVDDADFDSTQLPMADEDGMLNGTATAGHSKMKLLQTDAELQTEGVGPVLGYRGGVRGGSTSEAYKAKQILEWLKQTYGSDPLPRSGLVEVADDQVSIFTGEAADDDARLAGQQSTVQLYGLAAAEKDMVSWKQGSFKAAGGPAAGAAVDGLLHTMVCSPKEKWAVKKWGKGTVKLNRVPLPMRPWKRAQRLLHLTALVSALKYCLPWQLVVSPQSIKLAKTAAPRSSCSSCTNQGHTTQRVRRSTHRPRYTPIRIGCQCTAWARTCHQSQSALHRRSVAAPGPHGWGLRTVLQGLPWARPWARSTGARRPL